MAMLAAMAAKVLRLEALVRQLQGQTDFEVRAFSVTAGTGALIADPLDSGVSVARTAAGRYTVTWTRPWPNALYVVDGSCLAGLSGIGIWSVDGAVGYSATTFGCMTINSTVFADLNWFCVAFGPRA